MSTSYQPISGSGKTFTVPEHPSFADERAFHRLLVSASEQIVPREQKERICEKWGWDPEVECTEEVTGYVEYHLELARVVFEGRGGIPEDHADKVKPGVIQEARVDFIEGCQGRQSEQPSDWSGALQALATSLTGPGDTSTTTGTDRPTAGR